MVPRSKSRSSRRATLAGARVLVVDDHSVTVGMIKEALYAGGAAMVQSAPDGEAAIAMLNSFLPHLLVTDWKMPGMSGLELARAVRQAERRPDPRIANPRLPIVLVSAHASARAVEAARQAGVDEVVVKPFSMASLMKRIAAAANKPRAFIVSENYIGPDRRRRRGVNRGRRADDPSRAEQALDALAGLLDV